MTAPPKVCPICGSRYGFAATFCQKDGAQLSAEGSPDPFVGKTLLGQFRIEEPIGAGGMGTVYRAHQTTLSRNVAVKILHPELATNADAVRRFHREAKVATQLEHPNLVRVFLFGELPNEEGLYLIMEYLEGRSITDLLKTEGALPVPRALHIATQVCEGVGVAHAQGIVHRDVKPENIMLVQRHGDPDFVKVLDFGIARLLWDEQSALTQSGVIFGTARYISPEGASGEHTDARSDVYSIGILVYQLLTGTTPFDAQTPVAMLMKHIHDRPAPLRSVGRGAQVPQPVADAVMQALNKNPKHRYADATAFADALRSAASVSGVPLMGLRQSWSARTSLPPITSTPMTAPVPPVHAPSSTTDFSVAGLPKRPRFSTMIAAFVLGAVAVVGGVIAVDRLSGPSADEQRAALVDRAREALAAGHFDAPPGENVLELSGRILEEDPQHEGAKNVRREAVLRLFEEAARARATDDHDSAKAALERVLVFRPGDPQAMAALESLEEEHEHEHQAVGLQVTPNETVTGETVAFLAVTEHDAEVSRPAFEIWSRGRRLRRLAAANAHDEHWVTSYTFRTAGTYEIRFVGDGIDDSFRQSVTIGRRRPGVAVQQTRPPSTHFVPRAEQAPPPVMTTDDHGIDWTVPGTHTMQNPPDMEPPSMDDDHVPAPWTGTSTGGVL